MGVFALRKPRSRRRQRARQPIGRIVLFLLLVVVPIAGAATYFFGFAADRFESKSVFVVRTPEQAGIGSLANSGREMSDAFSQAQLPPASDDASAVKEFILSRDAMRLAAGQLDLRHMLAGPADDLLWHFPALFGGDSDEALYRTYLQHVDVHYNFNTGIGPLSVQGFSPSDAQRLATVLLNLAEDLVNRLNERGQQDATVRLPKTWPKPVSSAAGDRSHDGLQGPRKGRGPHWLRERALKGTGDLAGPTDRHQRPGRCHPHNGTA